MKTRLLNASHCAIGVLGSVLGLQRADEVMSDPVLRSYVECLMNEEVAPLLPRVPGIELAAYTRTLVERLSNPKIGDNLERLCRAGSSKVAAHVLPSIAAARAAGREHRLLTLAVAGWLRYVRGADERGRRLVLDDPLADALQSAALAGGSDPRPLLAVCGQFGDLSADGELVSELAEAVRELDRRGVRATLAGTLGERSVAA
jgi:mannitol-1-phosphate/altronate dehydrogenase